MSLAHLARSLPLALALTLGCGDSGGDGTGGGGTGPTHDDGDGGPVGAACADDTDCDQGERCNLADDDGRCTAIRSLGEGEPCSSNELCDDDRICAEACRAEGEAGEGDSCGEQQDPFVIERAELCEDGLTCVGQVATAESPESYTCLAPSGERGPCISDDDCAAPLQCLGGYHCAPPCVDGTCPEGYVCGSERCYTICSTTEDCPPGGYCDGGTCAADI
jgi:hypothetical protein